MRSLIYVPVIHEAVDLGSVSAAAHKKGDDILGPKEWERHKGVVNAFWERISDYFKDFDATGLEISRTGFRSTGRLRSELFAKVLKGEVATTGLFLTCSIEAAS